MGEIRRGREVINNNTRDLIESGVRPETAREMARESMRRVDRQQREEGKR